MKKIILFTGLLFSLIAFGQEYKIVFYDSLGMRSNEDLNFKKIVFEKNGEFHKISTYFEGKLYSVKIVKDTINYAKNMQETQYFENGKISKTSKYLENKLNGDIAEYYESGLNKSIYYVEYDNDNNFIYNIKEYWGKSGTQNVKDGNGIYEFDIDIGLENKKTVLRGNVVNGLFEGKFNSNTNEYPYFEEYYSKGKLLNGVRRISKTESKYYTEISIQAKPNEGMNEFRKQIGSQIKTKKQKTALEGSVIAKFIIDTEGKIINPIIMKSLNSYFDIQLIDILNDTEEWKPGEYRGLKIRQYFTLPIKIKVEETK
jgi:hypothetical protein